MSDIQPQSAVSTTEGLSRFFERMAQRRRHGVSTTAGLLRFLEHAEPILRTARVALAKPSKTSEVSALDVARLQRTLSILTEPLRLAPPLCEPLNVWASAGLKRDELRNAAVLAWFLNPHGSHGFGSAPLRAFLDEIARITPSWPQLGEDLLRVSVVTEEYPLGSTADRVDIAINGPDFVLFIEVKIAASEGPDQLRRYVEAIQRKARALGRKYGRVIYLSRTPPQDPPPEVAIITWHGVVRVLSSLPPVGMGGALVAQFMQHIRTFA